MADSTIRYFSYPRTETPPEFADDVASIFRNSVWNFCLLGGKGEVQ